MQMTLACRDIQFEPVVRLNHIMTHWPAALIAAGVALSAIWLGAIIWFAVRLL